MGNKKWILLLLGILCVLNIGCGKNDVQVPEAEKQQIEELSKENNLGLTECNDFHLQKEYMPIYVYEDESTGNVFMIAANLYSSDVNDVMPLFLFQKKEDGKYRAPVRIKAEIGNVVFRSLCMDSKSKKIYFTGVQANDISDLKSTAIELYCADFENYRLKNVDKVELGLKYVSVFDVDTQGNIYAFGYDKGESGIYRCVNTDSGYEKEKIESKVTGTTSNACYYLEKENKLFANLFYKENGKASIWEQETGEHSQTQREIALPELLDNSFVLSASVSSGDNYAYFVAADSIETMWETKVYKISTSNLLSNENPVFPEYISCSYDEYDNASFDMNYRKKGDMDTKRGVYYEIFVRAFADSDGDGIGDFNGITEKLDYLDDLGIDGIWLMPVNASPSYHGYDVTSYDTLNPDYGTEEDFKNMLEEAHKRGIKVIMDFVVNHTSDQHPWFQQALQDGENEYTNYYRWVNKNDVSDFNREESSPWDTYLWHKAGDNYYYGIFYSGMPDLNYNNPKVREEIITAAQKWLAMGVDGFRLDAAIHIYGQSEFSQVQDVTKANLQWWNEFAIACEEINPDVYLVGEAWSENERFAEYTQPFDTKFNFSMEQNLLEAVKNGNAKAPENGKLLAFYLDDIVKEYAKYDQQYLDGIFGSNHDQDRIVSQVGSEEKARLVASVYLTLPGNPFIYYGEELGMKGAKPDEYIREPFVWSKDGSDLDTTWEDNTYNKDTASVQEQLLSGKNTMHHFYTSLIKFRKEHSAIQAGEYEPIDAGNDDIMAYCRFDENEKITIFQNFSENTVAVSWQEEYGSKILYQTVDGCQIQNGQVLIPAYGMVALVK